MTVLYHIPASHITKDSKCKKPEKTHMNRLRLLLPLFTKKVNIKVEVEVGNVNLQTLKSSQKIVPAEVSLFTKKSN